MSKKQFLVAFFITFFSANIFAQTIPDQLEYCGMHLTFSPNAKIKIKKFVDQIQQSPRYYKEMVKRAHMYFPHIEMAFRTVNIPEDLKYLCIQESGLRSDVVSTSRAVGFWQFKERTGQNMGLTINEKIDERQHIYQSSKAAARYLTESNKNFNNWVYAVIAYYEGLAGTAAHTNPQYYEVDSMLITEELHWYALKAIAHKIAYDKSTSTLDNALIFLQPYNTNGATSLKRITEFHRISLEDFFMYNKWLLGKNSLQKNQNYIYYIPIPYSEAIEQGFFVKGSLGNVNTFPQISFLDGVQSSDSLKGEIYTKPAPPVIDWSTPNHTNVNISPIRLKFQITTTSDIYLVTINQYESDINLINRNDSIIYCEFLYDLSPGENNLQIKVVNGGGIGLSSQLKIYYQPEKTENTVNNYALIITNSTYQDSIWRDLPGSFTAGDLLKKELEEDHGFEVDHRTNLRRNEMYEVFKEYATKIYGPNDQLLIFFSGHGDVDIYGDSRVGFLATTDSKGLFRSTYYSHSQLRDVVDAIPCKHILLILDACFSSTFDRSIEEAITMGRGDRWEKGMNFENFKEEKLKAKSRLYLTSGTTQTRAGRGKRPSPFSNAILKSINKNSKVLTFGGLTSYIEKMKLNPLPYSGDFGSHQVGGSFLLILND